jgi:hypothetical protein
LNHLVSGRLIVVLPGRNYPGSCAMVRQFSHRTLWASRVKAAIDYLIAAFHKDEALYR